MSGASLQDARAMLAASFGYSDFRPGQAEAVQSVLDRHDTMVVLPTGGGKSLCFQVPALMLPGITVVVSPLISLMKDQVDALEARGLPAAFINSTLSGAQAADRMARAARGELKLLYVAPERFDAGNAAEQFRRIGVSLLAIDEAHCISQWGHDFRPSYLRVRDVRAQLGDPVTIALTATATPEVRLDIAQQLALREPRIIVTGFDRTNLTYHVLPARNDAEKDALLARTLEQRDGVAIVYASTRKSVERIAGVLASSGVPAMAYHAGLDDDHRHRVQDAFMTEKVRAIVATNAFGMGIDKPNVRLVVHHSMPGTLEAYYQEAGRAGRDGGPSEVYLLHSFPDRFTHEFFIKGAYPERTAVEQLYAVMQRAADPVGLVSDPPERLAARLGSRATARDVESALRILQQFGAVTRESESYTRASVRLLATPDRIRREITGGDNMELGLLRALWRAAGKGLETGAVVDLQGLPSGLGGPAELFDMLESLQDRQFLAWERVGGGLCLTAPSRPLASFRVDWSSLDRRRAGDMAKLQAMQKYAYTSDCRRSFVLRYFGDPAASATCSGCDNCLGITHEPVAATASRRAVAPRKRAKVGAAARPEADSASLASEHEPLFAALRALRSEIAREEQVPAYIVFDNRTLTEMATRRPASLAAFGALRGVGPVKTEKYGPRFVAAISSVAP